MEIFSIQYPELDPDRELEREWVHVGEQAPLNAV